MAFWKKDKPQPSPADKKSIARTDPVQQPAETSTASLGGKGDTSQHAAKHAWQIREIDSWFP